MRSDLICMAGVFQKTDLERDEQFNQTRLLIADTFGVQIDYLIPVRPKDIPKTSSGKLQRHQLKERFENGEFNEVLNALPTSPVPPQPSES